MWVHGPGYLAATGPSAGDGEATALWRRSLRLNAAARGKIKALIALCGSLWSLAFTESVVRVDWHSNGNGANLQFLPVYGKQRSIRDSISLWESHETLILQYQHQLSCLYTSSKSTVSLGRIKRDSKILFTLIAVSALVETLIIVMHCVGLLLQSHAGLRWPASNSHRERKAAVCFSRVVSLSHSLLDFSASYSSILLLCQPILTSGDTKYVRCYCLCYCHPAIVACLLMNW